uniref:NAD(P)H-hydrate epimerase n=1 Tax=Eutreptiella gymnastica TaxID=73025 RepID=A0A7S4CGZ0_9EUGL
MAGDVPHLTYVNAAQSQAIDDELMGERGFSIDCLMELAGLSVACAVQKQYTPCKLCIVCGPGNNGGDGLVAARHLCHFGFTVTIVYPKATTKELYLNLLNQCRDLAIPVLEQLPDLQTAGFELLMDAIFGFSFKGAPRAPFDSVLSALKATKIPIVSVDIPSGWAVDEGHPQDSLQPRMLVSLTCPKLCAKDYKGVHYVGGRFISPAFAQAHGLVLANYSGAEQCVRIDGGVA